MPGREYRLASAAREQWRRLADLPPPGAATRPFGIITGAYFMLGGVLASAVAWTHPETGHRPAITVLALVSVTTGALVAGVPNWFLDWRRRCLNLAGTAMILLAIELAGPGPTADSLFWLFCLAEVAAIVLFPAREAVPMMMCAARGDRHRNLRAPRHPPAELITATAVGVAVALTMNWLTRYAAVAEWDTATGMLNRKGLDRALTDACAGAERGNQVFSVAVVSAVGRSGEATLPAGPATDPDARRLAGRWLTDSPDQATWARIADLQFGVLWDGSHGFAEYLDRVREGAAGDAVAIGFCDWHAGVDPTQMMLEAFNGCAYSARTGGQVTRIGLVHAHVEELRAAISSGEVVAHYQPVADPRTGDVVGGEALARWRHPTRGWLLPAEFIPLAEYAGLIGQLGERILRQASRDAAGWRSEAGGPATLAVNVSGLQLQDPGFPNMVVEALADAGLPAAQLVLEVTESTLAADDPVAGAALARLRAGGVRVAMDDFGTGYSSLARLTHLPFDVLKVDRAFVQQLDEPGYHLLECILTLARRTGLCTVVEGIERTDQAATAIALGADLVQGWLFGRPMPAGRFPLSTRRELDGARARRTPNANSLGKTRCRDGSVAAGRIDEPVRRSGEA